MTPEAKAQAAWRRRRSRYMATFLIGIVSLPTLIAVAVLVAVSIQ